MAAKDDIRELRTTRGARTSPQQALTSPTTTTPTDREGTEHSWSSSPRQRNPMPAGTDRLPPTGTCDLSTVGRRSGRSRRVEIWYVVVDGQVVVTGTPGARHWLANLREHPEAVLHLREPARDVEVVGQEIIDEVRRRRVAQEAWRLQPWYAEQPYSLDDWVQDSPMVVLAPPQPCPNG